jgi:hypothetical protein
MKVIAKKTACALVASAAAVLAGAHPAAAGVTSINFQSGASLEDTGVTFAGSMSYDDVGRLLTVDLANTSSFQSVITGFCFNVAGDATADYNASDDAGTAGVDESAFANDFSLPPFGAFDAGVFLQNLSKQQVRGIDEGESGRFTFDLSGIGAASLTAGDFFSDVNTGGGLSGAFAVRFQSVGSKGQLSDKVMGVLVDDGDNGGGDNGGPPPTPVPLPPGAWAGLLTMGVAGVAQLRGRMRRRA